MYYIKTTIKHKTQNLTLELFRKLLYSVFPPLKFSSILHFAKIIFDVMFRTVKLTFPTHVPFPDFGYLPAINLSNPTMPPFKLCYSFCILFPQYFSFSLFSYVMPSTKKLPCPAHCFPNNPTWKEGNAPSFGLPAMHS